MLRIVLITIALCFSLPWQAEAKAATDAAKLPDKSWDAFDRLIGESKSLMMSDPAQALAVAYSAETEAQLHAEGPRQDEALATGLWLQSEALLRLNKAAEARPTIDRAFSYATRVGKDTKLQGDLNLCLARVSSMLGDLALSLKSFHKAYDIYVAVGDARGQSMALQGLAVIYGDAQDFEHEISYYKLASQAFSGDPALDLSLAHNLGEGLKRLGRYQEALESFQNALKISQKMDSPLLRARILTNIAGIYVRLKNLEAADNAADQALALLGNANDNVWGVKAEIEFDRGDIAKAKEYIARAFGGLNPNTTPSTFRDTHEIAFKIYMAAGDTGRAVQHHIALKRLDDEERTLAANTNLALMTAQFDFARQQFEIEHLRAEKLKRDVAVAKERARAQMTLFSSVVLIGVLIIIAIGFGYVGLRRHRNQIRRANVKLQRTISELDNEIVRRKETESELRVAKNEAERASHSKTQFLANMSHELRTPLNAIIGFAEMMHQEMLGSIGTPTYKTYAKDIMDSGQHLLAILNDILDMARIDAGRAELTESEIDLGETVIQVLRMFQEPTRTGGKVIQFRTPDIPVLLFADERLIRQILINLVSNAVKFTGADGRVEVRLEWPKDGGIDIVVADNGIGIPADKIAHVMERFGQVADALSRTRGGIGLGLPIVKALAELHGGTLIIESAQGKGTTARIRLPEDRVLKSANLEPAFG